MTSSHVQSSETDQTSHHLWLRLQTATPPWVDRPSSTRTIDSARLILDPPSTTLVSLSSCKYRPLPSRLATTFPSQTDPRLRPRRSRTCEFIVRHQPRLDTPTETSLIYIPHQHVSPPSSYFPPAARPSPLQRSSTASPGYPDRVVPPPLMRSPRSSKSMPMPGMRTGSGGRGVSAGSGLGVRR
jgi:hypothetical protein